MFLFFIFWIFSEVGKAGRKPALEFQCNATLSNIYLNNTYEQSFAISHWYFLTEIDWGSYIWSNKILLSESYVNRIWGLEQMSSTVIKNFLKSVQGKLIIFWILIIFVIVCSSVPVSLKVDLNKIWENEYFKYFSTVKDFVRVVIITVKIYWLKSVTVNKKNLSKFGFTDANWKKEGKSYHWNLFMMHQGY